MMTAASASAYRARARLSTAAFVVLFVVAGIAVVAVGRAALAAVAGQQIIGTGSGRCLEVPNSSTTNGTQVQLWDCNGAAGQSWTYTASKQLTVAGGKCLDASGRGTTDNTPVIIWDCNGQTNQQWNVNANGSVTGVQSGRCLDATGRGTANGTKIILYACSGQDNQQWTLTAPPSGGTGRPCDMYAAGGTPCVAAHSTVRALLSAYSGNLYQVRRSSDNTTRNIGVLAAGGVANAAAQDSFCAGTTCVQANIVAAGYR